MKMRTDLQVGVATHTGRVRSSNEDDFLVLAPQDDRMHARVGRWFVIADGMGGVSGGAEASRIAVRALCSEALHERAGDDREPEQRMRRGFSEACRRVHAMSRSNASLREMGTTLTAINLVGRRIIIGHVGDSRCVLVREGKLQALTQDHAVRTADHQLTRCIGGGRDHEEVDVLSSDIQVGDTLALLTDGLWDMVAEADLQRTLHQLAPQAAATRLVQLANARGGQDNATALVVRVARASEGAQRSVELELPGEEVREAPILPSGTRNLLPPRWPWLMLLLSVAVLALAVGKGIYDVDWLAPLVRRLRAFFG